jgi:hypothetical protein
MQLGPLTPILNCIKMYDSAILVRMIMLQPTINYFKREETISIVNFQQGRLDAPGKGGEEILSRQFFLQSNPGHQFKL